MLHFSKIHGAAAGLWLAGAAACAIFGGPSLPAAESGVVRSTPTAPLSEPECRVSNPAGDAKSIDAKYIDAKHIDAKSIDAQIERLRRSCALELQAFDECRASRPAWGTVELFSCGFEMSTSLAKGDVEDPASLADCGTPAPLEPATAETAPPEEPRALRRGTNECPVPACEAELENLEALKAALVC